MNFNPPRIKYLILFLASLCLPLDSLGADEILLSSWPVVDDKELAMMRGGFTTADGLDINIGLQQLVLIDGVLKSATSFDLSKLGNAGDPLQNNTQQNSIINIIQNGNNNLIPPEVPASLASGAMTIIQNSFDMQLIQNFTLFNVEVSKLDQFRNNALGAAIRLELVRSLR